MAERQPGAVTLRREGAVAVVTLDRPAAHNAFTVAMLRRLEELVAEVAADDDLHVLVLTGAGTRAFCAGADLGELIPQMTAGALDVGLPDPTRRFFSEFVKPIVAAVNGACLAGGLELLLGTDLRVAAEHAVFGLPEVRWGIVPGGGSHVRLPQQIGWPAAMRLLLTGEPVDAAEALRMGLVGEVVAAERVLPRAMELAATIAGNAPVAVRTAKEIAMRALANEPRFALEHALTARVLATRDAREGPAAFLEKRPPRYENR